MFRKIAVVILVVLGLVGLAGRGIGLALKVVQLVYEKSGAADKDRSRRAEAAKDYLDDLHAKSGGFNLSKSARAELDSLQRAGKQARPLADVFLQTIRQGQTAKAYDMTSVAFRSRCDADQFKELLRNHPALLQPRQSTGGYNGSINGMMQFYAPFPGTGDAKEGESFTLVLVPQANGYHIEEINFDKNR